MTNMKTSIIRLFDRIDPPQNSQGYIICPCGKLCKKSKIRWIKYPHVKKYVVRNQLPSGRLVGGELFDNQEQHEPEENILDQQIQLISGDKERDEQLEEKKDT
ncbi:unnamed protein product [Rotaria socialis]|uniref:Uncharacterized protein n=1 Tax=Rotaria socialis TaxID=392032 RepID=A0A817WFR5_9BILA|nr:unnamed protein product [Rotaria socialis]